jgi:hypothetical protein
VAAAPLLAPLFDALARVAQPWQDAYGNSKVLPSMVLFAHLGALLVGGGLALAADRGTLRWSRAEPVDRARQLGEIGLTHRPVVASLGVSFASGALLFLADVEAFSASPVFWVKMGAVALLLANGFLMTRAEGALRRAQLPEGEAAALWGRLRTNARASVALWVLTLLLGTVLANA